MPQIMLELKDALLFIIKGIENEQYEAAKGIAQDLVKNLEGEEAKEDEQA